MNMPNHLIHHNYYFNCLFIIILFLVQFTFKVSSHGRLIHPPGRSTAWRYGFPTTINYNDNELFCGGFTVQWELNDGKCGICGDSYSGIRYNELPDGKYTKPLIVTANYSESETITASVQLTANHRGFFTFRLCPAPGERIEVTQECLDNQVLEVRNSFDGQRFQYTVPDNAQRVYEVSLALPDGLTCSRCVLQWTYTAGNNWGPCGNGTSAVGCGPQETFRACADISINSGSKPNNDLPNDDLPEVDNDLDESTSKPSSSSKPTPSPTTPVTTINPKNEIERESVTTEPTRKWFTDFKPTTRPSWTPFSWFYPTAASTHSTRETEPTTPRFTWKPPTPTTTTPSPSHSYGGSLNCVSHGRYRKLSGMDQWCTINCAVGFCPSSHCKCQ